MQRVHNFAMPMHCMSPYRNVLRNSKYTSAKYHVHRVSRMRKYISLRSYASSVLQLAGLRGWLSCSQLCMLLACIYLYCTQVFNSSIIFGRTLVGSLPLANNVQHSASYIPVLDGLQVKLDVCFSHKRWESEVPVFSKQGGKIGILLAL